MVSQDEQALPVAGARAGDAAAWEVLFRRYQLPLYTYVQELVRQEQTSLDIVQETFVAAVRHIGGLREDARFGSWLFGIARQKCAQHWRGRQREERHLGIPEEPDEDCAGPGDDPSQWLIRREQEAAFFQRLEQLPEPHREVLLLHLVEEFSLEDIAGISGVPVGTVKSRLHYARKTLRQLLEEPS